MAHLWKRYFKKSDHVSECVERAVEEQYTFEQAHPVPYAPDQRAVALTLRFIRHFGASAVPADAAKMLDAASREWPQAARAAVEVP